VYSDILASCAVIVSVAATVVAVSEMAKLRVLVGDRVRFLETSIGNLLGESMAVKRELAELRKSVDAVRDEMRGKIAEAEIVPEQNVTAASRVAALRSKLWEFERLAASPEVER
jgi:hypothetical protein